MGSPHQWLATVALASSGLEFTVLPGFSNPFGLPEDDKPDVVLLVAGYPAVSPPPRDPSELRSLERFAPVVGLDGTDWFELAFPPKVVERLALVIKGQGIYRDRELYNYRVGAASGGVNWTEKLAARQEAYRQTDLDKLRLSFPCFAVDLRPIRRRTRKREAGPGRSRQRPMSTAERLARNAAEGVSTGLLGVPLGRPHQVHRVYSLTHIQRLDVLDRLEGLDGAAGLTSIPPFTMGAEATQDEMREAAHPLMRQPRGRLRYLANLHRHKIAVAPTGFGEVTFRHAEAWRAGVTLVAQDLGHVEVMFPLRDGSNVVYCRPDLSDLREVVERLLADHELRRRIAAQGHADYVNWARSWRKLISEGLDRHLSDLLGA